MRNDVRTARPRRRSRRRGPSRSASSAFSQTSFPTSRRAYAETRTTLLATYGPVCAYCDEKFGRPELTLDHVTPRRGQTAYDRQDNLVLACIPCNQKKRDMPVLAFLFANRRRSVNLLRNGKHLSQGLLELVRSVLPADFAEEDLDERSPYRG